MMMLADLELQYLIMTKIFLYFIISIKHKIIENSLELNIKI